MTFLQPLALALTVLPHGTPGEGWITLEGELERLKESGAPAARGYDDEDGGGWEFVIKAYLWFPDFIGDVGVGSILPVPVTKGSFEDQPGLIVQLDAIREGSIWGWMLEVQRLQFEADSAGNVADIDQAYLEADVFWRLPDLPGTDVFVGARVWNLDVGLDVGGPAPASESARTSFLDPVLGARTAIPIGEAWRFRARGDVAGLGVGSSLTWGGYLGMARRISASGEIDLSWRFVSLTYDDDFELEAQYSGPALGLVWGF